VTTPKPIILHEKSVIPVAVARGEIGYARVVTGGEDGRVQIKSIGESSVKDIAVVDTARVPGLVMEESVRHPGTGSSSTSIAFSANGERIVTANEDGSVMVWALAEHGMSDVLAERWSLMSRLRGHKGSVLTAMFSPDGNRVLTASSDGSAQIWDVAP